MTSLHATVPELDDLLEHLFQTSALIESGIVLSALVVAWALVRLVRGAVSPVGSIWFGRRIYDGVLFPVVALALVVGARHLLLRAGLPLAVFKLALPVLFLSGAIFFALATVTRSMMWAYVGVVGFIIIDHGYRCLQSVQSVIDNRNGTLQWMQWWLRRL